MNAHKIASTHHLVGLLCALLIVANIVFPIWRVRYKGQASIVSFHHQQDHISITTQPDTLPSDLMTPFLSMTVPSSQHTPQKRRKLAPEQCPHPTKPAQLTDATKISSLADDPCCSNNCLSHISVVQILSLRECYAACNEFECSSMIITIMGASVCDDNSWMDLHVFGTPFCLVGFCRAYGFSCKKWVWCLAIFQHGGAVAIHGCQGTPSPSLAHENSHCWLATFFDIVGDHLPDGTIHLPVAMT